MSADRNELFKKLWAMCNDVRGAVEGWDFKQYVYGALFYRYLSERMIEEANAGERSVDPSYDYVKETDANAIQEMR